VPRASLSNVRRVDPEQILEVCSNVREAVLHRLCGDHAWQDRQPRQ
jgi:hypothetical protein